MAYDKNRRKRALGVMKSVGFSPTPDNAEEGKATVLAQLPTSTKKKKSKKEKEEHKKKALDKLRKDKEREEEEDFKVSEAEIMAETDEDERKKRLKKFKKFGPREEQFTPAVPPEQVTGPN